MRMRGFVTLAIIGALSAVTLVAARMALAARAGRPSASPPTLIESGPSAAPAALVEPGPSTSHETLVEPAQNGIISPDIKPLDLRAGFWDFNVHVSTIVKLKRISREEIEKATPGMSADDREKYLAKIYAKYDAAEAAAKKGADKDVKMCPLDQKFERADGVDSVPQSCTQTIRSSGDELHIHVLCRKGTDDEAEQWSDFVRTDAENMKGTTRVVKKTGETLETLTTYTWKWIRDTCADTAAANAPHALMFARNIWHGNDYGTEVANLAKAPMTAYAIDIVMYGPNVSRHFYDARMVGQPPIKPGGVFEEDRAGIVTGAKALGAVFADGSTYGGEKEVHDIMQRRKWRLAGLKAAEAYLCSAEQKGDTREQVMASVQGQKSKLPNLGSPMANEIQQGVFDDVRQIIGAPRGGHPFGIAETRKKVEDAAALLAADPVKDANGNFYIMPAETQLSCGGGK